jgi:hypothetical protein
VRIRDHNEASSECRQRRSGGSRSVLSALQNVRRSFRHGRIRRNLSLALGIFRDNRNDDDSIRWRTRVRWRSPITLEREWTKWPILKVAGRPQEEHDAANRSNAVAFEQTEKQKNARV